MTASVYNVVIVGRPNVGKSRLFNRLTKRRISIVHDTAGVTRDIVAHEIMKNVVLMDTGGFGLSGKTDIKEITAAVEEQVYLAIAAADLILFIVDASVGIAPMDYEIADILRKGSAKVIVIANKIDSNDKAHLAEVFRVFGFGDPIVASAEHGIGEDTINELIIQESKPFSDQCTAELANDEPIRITFVGRPNVGKSSLVNALLKEKRLIVSDIPGTTREAVLVKLQSDTHQQFELLDTAGARPQNRITTSLDYFASLRADSGVTSCDVVFLVVDSMSGITQLDKKLANSVVKAGKGLVLVINKWDVAQRAFDEGDLGGYKTIDDFQSQFLAAARKSLNAFPKIEAVFVSAHSGYGVDELLPSANKLFTKMNQKIGTGPLNRVIQKAFEHQQPSIASGKRFRIYYVVQTGSMPFVFKLFCNRKAFLSETYKKYLLNVLRKTFDLYGCVICLEFSEKDRRFLDQVS